MKDRTDNPYFIDPESASETARLIEQDQLFNEHMGGLFPPGLDLSLVNRVLDIGCGPGGWALEVVFAYPDMDVVGIDASQAMINYARTRASFQIERQNTHELHRKVTRCFSQAQQSSVCGTGPRAESLPAPVSW